jgi:citronellol/citronellal dehydrogenase
MSDAAHIILTRDSRSCTGNFYIDDIVLSEVGVTNFDKYAVKPGAPLMPDFFVEDTPSGLPEGPQARL